MGTKAATVNASATTRGRRLQSPALRTHRVKFLRFVRWSVSRQRCSIRLLSARRTHSGTSHETSQKSCRDPSKKPLPRMCCLPDRSGCGTPSLLSSRSCWCAERPPKSSANTTQCTIAERVALITPRTRTLLLQGARFPSSCPASSQRRSRIRRPSHQRRRGGRDCAPQPSGRGLGRGRSK